jgi:hypothetical protein
METYGADDVHVHTHVSLTSALVGGECRLDGEGIYYI